MCVSAYVDMQREWKGSEGMERNGTEWDRPVSLF